MAGTGGGGGARLFPRGFDPIPTPFVLFWDIHFWPRHSTIFLKTPSALMFTNIEGEARNIFQNVLTILSKSAFFDLFFFKILVLWERSENQFSQPKKSSTKYSYIRNASLTQILYIGSGFLTTLTYHCQLQQHCGIFPKVVCRFWLPVSS